MNIKVGTIDGQHNKIDLLKPLSKNIEIISYIKTFSLRSRNFTTAPDYVSQCFSNLEAEIF